jgi:hypothetical protein
VDGSSDRTALKITDKDSTLTHSWHTFGVEMAMPASLHVLIHRRPGWLQTTALATHVCTILYRADRTSKCDIGLAEAWRLCCKACLFCVHPQSFALLVANTIAPFANDSGKTMGTK